MLPLSLARACTAPRLAPSPSQTAATATASTRRRIPSAVPSAERRRALRRVGAQRFPANRCSAVAASAIDPDSDSSGDEYYESCSPGYVTVDNASSPSCTKLHLEAQDYIGLTRVVAWVLGGLGLRVRDARLTTGDDGWAKNEFWVTTEAGAKLSDKRAQSVSERLAEFVTYCTPPHRKAGEEPKCEAGGISVDSSERAHKRWTVVTVRAGGGESGPSSSSTTNSSSSTLLDVANAVSGAGIEIREAIIQGGPACAGGGGDRPTIDEDPEDGEEEASSPSSKASSSSSSLTSEPAMRLWVCEPATGGRLSYVRCAALLQTLSLALGRGGGPSLVPPAPVTLLGGGGGGGGRE